MESVGPVQEAISTLNFSYALIHEVGFSERQIGSQDCLNFAKLRLFGDRGGMSQ